MTTKVYQVSSDRKRCRRSTDCIESMHWLFRVIFFLLVFIFVTEKILRCTANNVSKFLSLSHHWEKSGFVCVDSWIKDGGSLEPIFFFKHISRSTNPSFGVPFKKRHARNKNQRPLFNRNDRNVPLKQNLHSTLNPPLTTRKRVFSHPLVNSHCKS